MKIDLIRLLHKPRKIITAIDIDNNWLRIVQVEHSQVKKIVSNIVVREVASLSHSALKDMVINLSRELKISSDYLVVCIRRSMATSRNLELPSTNPNEIRDMIDLQIGKQTPYASDEVIRDYQILESNVDGYSKALLVIVHRDIVERYFKIFEAAELKVGKVGISSEGLLSWSRLIRKQELTADRAYILIEIDYDTCDFEVIFNDKLIFGRSISLGFPQSEGAKEQWYKKFIEEINHSIYAFQNEVMDKEIDRVVISCSSNVAGSLNKDALEAAFNLPIEIIDQFERIPLTALAQESYNNLPNRNLVFSSLLGLALTFEEQKINLIPQELQIERSVQEKGKDLYRMGIYLVFILIAVSGIFLGRIYNKERYLGQLRQRLLEIQTKTEKLTDMVSVVETVRYRTQTRGISLNLIYEVHRVIPPDIHLSSLSFDGKELLLLRGSSNLMSEVFNLVSKLEESEYFQNVQTKFATKHIVKDKEVTDFEISCPLAEKYKGIDKRGL